MSASAKDLIIGAVALVLIAILFAVVDLLVVFNLTRDEEGWNLDEIVAAVPALMLGSVPLRHRARTRQNANFTPR